MNEDQELLDRFAIAAMNKTNWNDWENDEANGDQCYRIAVAMKQARDRICTTAKPAEMDPGPFPKIDMEA